MCFVVERITCRDATPSRIERLKRMLASYLFEEDFARQVKIEINYPISLGNKHEDLFDKVN